MDTYDSTADTLKHIRRVSQLLTEAAIELIHRANRHDDTKLHSPEKEVFDRLTPKLAACTYGSEEYKECLKDMQLALSHHYQANSHHPEFYPNGINGFDLFDLIEMFFDWKAASERHSDGDIFRENRFAISEQLVSILENTAHRLGYTK